MSNDEEKLSMDDLEPGDRSEKLAKSDYCLAAGCGGCIDPIGCVAAMGQGCLGFIEGCLAQLGCSVLVLGLLGWGITGLVSLFSGAG